VARIVSALPQPGIMPVAARPTAPRTFLRSLIAAGAIAGIAIAAFTLPGLNQRTNTASVAGIDSMAGVVVDAVPAVSEPSITLVTDMSSLTDAELETLIAEVDDMEGIPSLEPQQVPLSLDELVDTATGSAG
jgi:hypothetical protein